MEVQTEQRGLLRIGDQAPDFEANSTHGPIKLSGFKGQWVLLFSHPADFTPVCTTEFIEFSRRHAEFEKRGVQLIGNSIDSIYSHLAWIRNIEQHFDVKVPFPVIADLDMKVSQLYGMIHPAAASTATVRTVYFIDPSQMIRAIIYYPLTTGRNIEEILRVLDALQTTDANGVATPANWCPGHPVIVPPPTTYAAAEERMKQKDLELKDWYFAKKKL